MKFVAMSCMLFYLLLFLRGLDAEYGPEMTGERAVEIREDECRDDRQQSVQPALCERAVDQVLLLQEGRIERYGDDAHNDHRAHRLLLCAVYRHDNSSLRDLPLRHQDTKDCS